MINRALQFAIPALLCGLLLSGAASSQSLPDGPGKAEFVHNCLDCHSAGMVLRAKKTPDEWRKNVDDMAARGSDGSKEDIDKVVFYLDKYFAMEPPAPPSPPATHPPDSERGRPVMAANGRLLCHRSDAHTSRVHLTTAKEKTRISRRSVTIAYVKRRPLPAASS